MENFKKEKISIPVFLYFIIDFIVIVGMFYFARYLVQLNEKNTLVTFSLYKNFLVYIAVYLLIAVNLKVYRRKFDQSTFIDILYISCAFLIAALAIMSYQLIFYKMILFRFTIVVAVLTIVMTQLYRFLFLLLMDIQVQATNKDKKRALIIGAGEAGRSVVSQMRNLGKFDCWPIGYLDDDPAKQNNYYSGIPVLGTINDLQDVVARYDIEQILIAIPSADSEVTRKISQMCLKSGIPTDIIPYIEDALTGKIKTDVIRTINVEDILGREKVVLSLGGLREQIENKTVLVTGAGGTIGSEICRQLVKLNPSRLVLLGHGENSIYLIHKELRNLIIDTQLNCVICDIKDKKRLDYIFQMHRPDVVYHAAAHKHVPLMEENVLEAIHNNIFGTYNVVTCAKNHNTKYFVMISTDKAVNPTSVMGATKRIAEEIVRAVNDECSDMRYIAVRFGNVLGSRGSVVPLFQEQIAKGGPVTITDRRMIRYFMSIPEAASLVLRSGSLEDAGEIYVLDMGEPVRILDLAKTMIQLSNRTEDEIKIVEIGIRSGEKLYEELITSKEKIMHKVDNKIFVANTQKMDVELLKDYLAVVNTLSEEQAKIRTLDLARMR